MSMWTMGSNIIIIVLIKRTLGFIGDEDVKYADVVSGGEGMTMVLKMTGGPTGMIQPPMLIFRNAARSYPIKGVPDNVTGAKYRTGPKGWMDKTVFAQWLGDRSCNAVERTFESHSLFLDNCGGHNRTPESNQTLKELSYKLCFFPPNATDLLQPLDSFVISKVKDEWTRNWNKKKMELINADEWSKAQREGKPYSGKLKNPGKTFFLQLAAQSVRAVNNARDDKGTRYARKAFIMCGLSKDLDGVWKVEQLTSKLQELIAKYPVEFAGDGEEIQFESDINSDDEEEEMDDENESE